MKTVTTRLPDSQPDEFSRHEQLLDWAGRLARRLHPAAASSIGFRLLNRFKAQHTATLVHSIRQRPIRAENIDLVVSPFVAPLRQVNAVRQGVADWPLEGSRVAVGPLPAPTQAAAVAAHQQETGELAPNVKALLALHRRLGRI